MSTSATTRKALTMTRAQKTPEATKPVQAKGSVQVHVLPESSKKTLCGINPATWKEKVELAEDAKFNCPVCAEALKAQAKKAKTEAI
jgi:hypothetical protein